MSVQLYAVVSSNIAAVGYDAESMVLYVKFKNGSVHAYEQVPAFEYLGLRAAPSVGKRFAANIKGKFQSRPVEATIA